MSPRNKIFLHCGLHKTGTTALQAALRGNEPVLRQSGFLFPYSGSLCARNGTDCKPAEAGHHNIAWELTRDRRYSSKYGGLDTLRAEIAPFSGDVILSSEDFETILTVPERFSALRQLAEETSRDLVLVIYLRNQISYLESAYGQLLFNGFGQEYARCAEQVLASGMIQRNEWQFQFDYKKIFDVWEQVPDVELMIRDYHAFSGPALINDFAACVGIGSLIDPTSGGRAVNEREPILRAVARFCRNRIGRSLNPIEAARVRHLCADLPPRLDSGVILRNAFASRFNGDNQMVRLKNNLPGSGLLIPEAPEIQHPVSLAELFSFETQCAVRFGTVENISSAIKAATADLPIAEIDTIKPPPARRRRQIKYFLNSAMQKAYFTDLEFFDI